jgi:hypothetical protein
VPSGTGLQQHRCKFSALAILIIGTLTNYMEQRPSQEADNQPASNFPAFRGPEDSQKFNIQS